jgi:DMSO/TMAO reductase YedYZ molybdopterin-dependent catalytic subunit
MDQRGMTRRRLLTRSGMAAGGFTMLQAPLLARAGDLRPGEEVVPWLDQPPTEGNNLQPSEELARWITPNEKFFEVHHYDQPSIDAHSWSLEISGLVRQPITLTLPMLKSMRRQEVAFTIECSGNHADPSFSTAIGNARWGGAPLAPLLRDAGILENGREVVFWGSDTGEDVVREMKFQQNFARSMSLDDAMNPDNLLCYEMNGKSLPQPNGFPVRLIAPGWYGVANVKWLKRIEIRDARYMGPFMAREYVTIREEQRNGQKVVAETSVSRALLKSMPLKLVRHGSRYRIIGAAWGAPIAHVDVRIDDGPWISASLDRGEHAEHAWKLWSLKWDATPGLHTISSRAMDWSRNVQPAADDPRIMGKKTVWENNGQVSRHVLI